MILCIELTINFHTTIPNSPDDGRGLIRRYHLRVQTFVEGRCYATRNIPTGHIGGTGIVTFEKRTN